MNIGSISRFVLKHKALVGAFWLIVTITSIATLPWVFDNLSESFEIPGSESADMAAETAAIYGNDGASAPLVLTVTLPEGQTVESPGFRDEWLALESTVTEAEPSARVASWATTGDPAFVSDDRRTTFGLVYLATDGFLLRGLEPVRAALDNATVAEAPVYLTGRPVLESAGGEEEGGGVLIETLIGGVGALVVLLYIFGSALAFMPLIIAAVSILTSFLVIGGLTTVIDINSIVQFLVALIGLGVAIDYALLVVKRWREERLAGNPNELAVQRAMETAGHAVVFSGTTVGVGLLALIAVPVPFFRGLGVGGMVIPLTSVLVTITLLPVILATIGPAMDRVGIRSEKPESHRGWERWGRLVVRNRWAAAGVGLVLLALLMIPATQIAIGSPRPDSLNSSGEPRIGLEALEASGIDAGVLDPLTVLVHGDPASVADAIVGVEGVRGAVAPEGEGWRRDGATPSSLVAVIPQSNGDSASGRDLTSDVRAAIDGQVGDPLVGGGPAASADFVETVYGSFPLMILLVAVVTYVLLVRAFRSMLLPLKALFLNVLSVAAAYGVLVMVWQWGWGSELIWGIESTGSITDWIPIMTFAFLFGLSMDYEVFIMHRMREEYDAGHDTDTAIVRGLAFTGKLVTCAALILFLAFVAMSSTPQTEIKMLATGLAAGIIIDATVIRAFLVPALTSLLGKWNWWLPSWLAWIAPKPTALTPTVEPGNPRRPGTPDALADAPGS